MPKIRISIIQPTQTKIDNEYDHVIVPGVDGDFGVSAEHTPFITKLRPGIISLYTGKDIDKYAVHDGFCTVENDHLKIVCETCEHSSEINLKRAEDAKLRAEKRIKKQVKEEETDFRRAENALKRAIARMSINVETI